MPRRNGTRLNGRRYARPTRKGRKQRGKARERREARKES